METVHHHLPDSSSYPLHCWYAETNNHSRSTLDVVCPLHLHPSTYSHSRSSTFPLSLTSPPSLLSYYIFINMEGCNIKVKKNCSINSGRFSLMVHRLCLASPRTFFRFLTLLFSSLLVGGITGIDGAFGRLVNLWSFGRRFIGWYAVHTFPLARIFVGFSGTWKNIDSCHYSYTYH